MDQPVDRLLATGALRGQQTAEVLGLAPKTAKRIVNGDRPIDPGNDSPRGGVRRVAESNLGDMGHTEVQSAIRDAIGRIRACGKPAGILATDEATTRRYMEWGTTFTAVGLDVMVLGRELEKLAQKFRF